MSNSNAVKWLVGLRGNFLDAKHGILSGTEEVADLDAQHRIAVLRKELLNHVDECLLITSRISLDIGPIDINGPFK